MADSLVVGTKVKEAVHKAKAKMSEDFLKALNKKVEELIKAAVKRAKSNGRITVRGYDL